MAVALLVRRVVAVEGVERAIGEIIELSPMRAVMALQRHGHALGFAPVQPTNHKPPTIKRARRKRGDAQAVHA